MQDNNKFIVPLSIIVAGGMIAGAIYFGGTRSGTPALAKAENAVKTNVTVDKVTEKDHLLGDPNATLTIVEYADIDCPFCKVFHSTMKDVMEEYKGKVAWVYRQFPLNIHPNAEKKAQATECVNELGGNQAFWKYLDSLYDAAGTPKSSADTPELARIASGFGVDTQIFTTCLDSGKYEEFVKESIDAAAKAGARGTPYSVILTKDGKQVVINGAEPIASLRVKIDSLLK